MSKRILANDGIAESGKRLLEAAGFVVETEKIEQNELASKIGDYHAIVVRSATQVNEEIINAGTQLQVIGRAGVGLDNIDLVKAKEKGIEVVNTPGASSRSVAELVMAHTLSLSRNLYTTNRELPIEGGNNFKSLKKASRGTEVFGKTMAIIGFGKIGQETASLALGMGMQVVAVDPFLDEAEVPLAIHPNVDFPVQKIKIKTISLEEALVVADVISLHVPAGDRPLLSVKEFDLMKENSILINCARGGIVDESALMGALNSNKVAFAGLDVFQQEPPIDNPVLKHEMISLSPHVGGNTEEAQDRIGVELAEKIIKVLQ